MTASYSTILQIALFPYQGTIGIVFMLCVFYQLVLVPTRCLCLAGPRGGHQPLLMQLGGVKLVLAVKTAAMNALANTPMVIYE